MSSISSLVLHPLPTVRLADTDFAWNGLLSVEHNGKRCLLTRAGKPVTVMARSLGPRVQRKALGALRGGVWSPEPAWVVSEEGVLPAAAVEILDKVWSALDGGKARRRATPEEIEQRTNRGARMVDPEDAMVEAQLLAQRNPLLRVVEGGQPAAPAAPAASPPPFAAPGVTAVPTLAPTWHVVWNAATPTPVQVDARKVLAAALGGGEFHVWREGMDAWKGWREVPEIANLVAAVPAGPAMPPVFTVPVKEQQVQAPVEAPADVDSETGEIDAAAG